MPRMKPLPEGTPTEPIWYLRALPYGDYRMSNWWRIRRERFNDTAISIYGCKTCELCGLASLDPLGQHPIAVRFHVHHRNYDHLGYELDSDLMLLCSPCHNLIHRPESNAARHWVTYNDAGSNFDLAERAAEILREPAIV